jgi:hypothetical protein
MSSDSSSGTVALGTPSNTYYSVLTQYDPSIDSGKSACTYIASITALQFLNYRDVGCWEALVQRGAEIYLSFQTHQLSHSLSQHSSLEDALSAVATAPECAADEYQLPLVRGLDDSKFGVLLRSSKPRSLPPRRQSRVDKIRELLSLFGDEFLVEMADRILDMFDDNVEMALNHLLENRESVLAQQLVIEEGLQEQQQQMQAWARIAQQPFMAPTAAGSPMAAMMPYSRPTVEQQLQAYARDQETRYRHLQMRIEQERELLQAESAMYEVVEGKRGLGEWALCLLAPYLHSKRLVLVFTAQMQTMCLLIDIDGTALFRDSHKYVAI